MFYPIEGGSVYEVPDNAFGFVFECHLPPVGYGVNSNTGELEETDIIKRSEVESEQYWERFELPKDWKQKRAAEKERQLFDKYYFDAYLETIRQREWHRRLCGVWFWNNGKLLYITGTHYFYITYWKFQGKLMDFRINDMECWYVIKYCEIDPNSLGINEITKRKLGKTAKLGCWMYERASRCKNHHAGLQSKSDDDAAEVMKKAIVQPWQKLPDFFRPIYDTMKGDDPNELRFFYPSKRSMQEKERDEIEEPLESWIDFGAAGESVYDGPELGSYGSDESGKTKKPVSIKERQSVTRYCAEIDGEFKDRKQYYTTTVEVEKGEEENYEFQEMTANSNPLERDANGRTGTGLYTYFLPAYKGMFFDKYGYPDEERALTFINNTIKGYEEKGDTRGLSSFKRKNPRTFKEAFSTDGEFSLYNPEILNTQLDDISWTNKLTERGDLVWKDGMRIKRKIPNSEREVDGQIVYDYEPSEIQWVSNPNGKYEKIVGWTPREPNNVYWDYHTYRPNNSYLSGGCDPFRYDKTKDKRRSNCGGLVYQSPDPLFPDQYDNSFVLGYLFREESTRQANEDILKMMWWCGCDVLFERQVNHWKADFVDWECGGFLVWMDNEVEPGIATNADVIQTICNYTEAYINKYIKKVFFKSLIRKETGWLGFKVEDTEKFDYPMTAGITLINARGKVYKDSGRLQNISDFFPSRRS